MEIKLNHLELDFAKEAINIGLAKAADSLSFFTKDKVLIRSSDLEINNIQKEKLFNKSSDPLTILTTQIRGGMTGYCYLIFTQEEVEKLYKLSLPPNILDNPKQMDVMGKEILMEVDNIITAAVVTQFSNLFKIEMHGYVPEHFSGNKQEIDSFIRSHVNEKNLVLHFNTPLVSKDQSISPEFLWCLDMSFVEAVKNFVKQDSGMISLN